MSDSFPDFTFDGFKLQFVSKFRYLGHILSDDLSDDDDIRTKSKTCLYVLISNPIQPNFICDTIC